MRMKYHGSYYIMLVQIIGLDMISLSNESTCYGMPWVLAHLPRLVLVDPQALDARRRLLGPAMLLGGIGDWHSRQRLSGEDLGMQ